MKVNLETKISRMVSAIRGECRYAGIDAKTISDFEIYATLDDMARKGIEAGLYYHNLTDKQVKRFITEYRRLTK